MVETLNIQREFEKADASSKAIFGLSQTLRALKKGTVDKVIYANNAPSNIVAEIESYAKNTGAHIVKFDGDSKELAIPLQRNHGILVAAVLKG